MFEEYGHAVASLALWAVIMLSLSPISVQARTEAARAECGRPKRDYDDRGYRADRALMNAVEATGPFVAATLAAMFAGASPFWVNLLASVALVARIVMLVIHLRGIGKPNAGPRSIFYVLGWACMFILGLIALVAAF